MCKISFKEDSKKVDVFNGKVTVVTLTGYMETPKGLHTLPANILNWVWGHSSIIVVFDYNNNKLCITSTGKAVCAEGDVFNLVIGERIAESRAKIKLYKFMVSLTGMMMKYYWGIVFGIDINVTPTSNRGLMGWNIFYIEAHMRECRHLRKLLSEHECSREDS